MSPLVRMTSLIMSFVWDIVVCLKGQYFDLSCSSIQKSFEGTTRYGPFEILKWLKTKPNQTQRNNRRFYTYVALWENLKFVFKFEQRNLIHFRMFQM